MLGYALEQRPREVYRIEITEKGFRFTVKENLYLFLLDFIKMEEILTTFKEIAKTTSDDLALLEIHLPFIPSPNHAHKRLDWEALCKCAKQMSVLFDKLNMPIEENGGTDIYLSEGEQHVLIDTSYVNSPEHKTAPVGVGFSKKICDLLAKKYVDEKEFPDCEKVTFDLYHKLATSTVRERSARWRSYLKYGGPNSGVAVRIRENGIPHFIVPGNCACLGANPDDFQYDREMFSHNMDTSLQQIAMVTSLVSFWNQVITPLHKEEEK